ncbi:MAG: sulfurtransferase [Rhodobacterales bacterium]|nr:sulfurtransferase [Rhodobacterales bacterium]
MFNLFRSATTGPRVQRLAGPEAVRLAAEGALTLVDVRDIAELRSTGRAAGALHVPLMRLSAKADPRHPEHLPALDPEKPVALYCASGARSQMAAQMLLQLGYRTVYNLGGLHDWRAAGGQLAA